MITYKNSKELPLETVIDIRLSMLRVVNGLSFDYKFSDELIKNSEEYFSGDHHTTILAFDEKPVACASLCYIDMMPTFSHRTGKRAHLMNVYTDKSYRRKGIAKTMLMLLIDEAKKCGVTEISLDATESGRPLYESLGFKKSNECMTLNLAKGDKNEL